MSLGMIPIVNDLEPQNNFVHPDTLVGATKNKTLALRTAIDCYDINPVDLANKIDWLASQDEDTIARLSDHSNNVVVGWEEAKAMYEQLLWDTWKQ